MPDFYIRTKKDLEDAVREFGFIPYFRNSLPGFSIEEHVDPKAWFYEDLEGVWEWKGPVIRETGCAYGKFFEKKAAYVRQDLFCDLANYRRNGYDFDALWDDGLARFQDKQLYELIVKKAPVLSRDLRETGGYAYNGRWQKTEGKKGFDPSITRLQEQCYVLISDFVYTLDKKGYQRGWGVAEYSTPEIFMGDAFTENVYKRKPEESYERLMDHLMKLFPAEPEKSLKKFLK